MLDSLVGNHPSFAALVLRVVIGIIFVAHGYQKLFKKDLGPKGFSAFLQSIRIPAPLFFAYAVGIVEFFGGLLLIVGLWSRLVALLIALDMASAMITVRFKTGLLEKVMEGNRVGGYELHLSLFAIAIALAASGAGVFSVDRLLQ